MKDRHAGLSKDRVEAFSELYHENLLGEYETRSGTGATLMATRNLRKALQRLLQAGMCRSVLDVGCGEFNWQSSMSWNGVRYLGLDLVEAIVTRNTQCFAADNIAFLFADAVQNVPQDYDLVLCRDVFTHLAPADVARIFNRVKASGAKFIACTSYAPEAVNLKLQDSVKERMNIDADVGYWRPSNLCYGPYYVKPPLWSIPENEPGKSLDFWKLDDIEAIDLEKIGAKMHSKGPITPRDFEQYEFYRKIKALPFVRGIALFGSRVKNTYRATSDIDLLLYCDPQPTREQWADVCAIIDAADTPLHIDCVRFADTLAHEMYEYPNIIQKPLYERPAD